MYTVVMDEAAFRAEMHLVNFATSVIRITPLYISESTLNYISDAVILSAGQGYFAGQTNTLQAYKPCSLQYQQLYTTGSNFLIGYMMPLSYQFSCSRDQIDPFDVPSLTTTHAFAEINVLDIIGLDLGTEGQEGDKLPSYSDLTPFGNLN